MAWAGRDVHLVAGVIILPAGLVKGFVISMSMHVQLKCM